MNPRNYQGTKDFLGTEAATRKWVVDKMVSVFESFGFELLETPIIELAETLTGKTGGETNTQIFLFKRGDEEVGLRFDQTVPLARVLAQYANDLKLRLPYKRCAIGPCFRAEKPQAGRYRQFSQIDIDTVGSPSPQADAEIITIALTILEELGLKDAYVALNDRKILNALVSFAKLNEDEGLELLRLWDKLDKKALPEALPKSTLTLTRKLLKLPETNEEILQALEKLTPKAKEGVAELRQIIKGLKSYGFEEKVRVVPTLTRGLDYYTGAVFELKTTKSEIGSLGGGGRYDKLIAKLGGPDLPATGISFGLERVVAVLEKLNLLPKPKPADVFVTIFDVKEEAYQEAAARVAKEVRRLGKSAEVYVGEEGLSKQLSVADRKSIPFAAIIGPNELARGTVTLKDLTMPFDGKKDKNLTQREVRLEEIDKILS